MIEKIEEFKFQPMFGSSSIFKKDSFEIRVNKLTECAMIHVDNFSIRDYREPGAVAYDLTIRAALINNDDNIKRRVGTIGIWITRWPFFETHCDGLGSYFNLGGYIGNEGWGLELYYQMINWALNNGMDIRSSKIDGYYGISNEAMRVWQSKRLRRHFKILVRNGRFRVMGRT